MTDIHTIKNLFYFFPYLKVETWYMLAMGIAIFTIYIAYLMAFEHYYNNQKAVPKHYPQKNETLQEVLSNLDIDDDHFFENLSFSLRHFFEENNQILLATKKTSRDLKKESSLLPELKDILEICAHYEYSTENATREKKQAIIKRLEEII